MNKSVCIVSQSHLCRNPRVWKEATALAKAGYRVTVLTGIYSGELLMEDFALLKDTGVKYEFYSDLRGLASFGSRLVKSLAGILQAKTGIESKYSIGYNARRLKNKIKVQHADLYIMHQEFATLIGSELIDQYKIAFDLEDWYAEDLLPEARKTRPVKLLKKAETVALTKCIFCTTTSKVLAGKLAETYKSKAPAVIYNTFPLQEGLLSKPKTFIRPLKLLWFSQTIGPGRGLKEFISLMPYIKTGLELHLLGNIDNTYRNELNKLMPAQHQLFFHPLVSNTELPEKIAGFDIGLALELSWPPSRDYTITNKFFQYLQGGIPVIATKTKGQKEAFKNSEHGYLLPQAPGAEDITALARWLDNPDALLKANEKAKEAARVFCWENELSKLIQLVNRAV